MPHEYMSNEVNESKDALDAINAEIRDVLSEPSVSYWLKNALQAALERDCVDAEHDAQRLADLLGRRAQCVESFALAATALPDLEIRASTQSSDA